MSRSRPRRRAALLIALAGAGLAGCGQTGPLYLPPETEPLPPPSAASAAPAAVATVPAPASTSEAAAPISTRPAPATTVPPTPPNRTP